MIRRASDVAEGQAHNLSIPERCSGAGPATNWPLGTSLALAALPTAPRCARLHARAVLWEWGLSHLSDSVELVVDELTANAVAASAGLDGHWWQGRHFHGQPPVRLTLHSDGQGVVLVRVWDGCEEFPTPQQPGPGEESGRGLLLVRAVSVETGTSRLEGTTGKVVWSVVVGTALA